MPKTFRVNIAGGIDAVSDLAMGDGSRVVYMENLDVRGGTARPYNLPLINPNISVPAGSVQVYSYRGRIIFSSKRRHYTAEYVNDRERIYWTEYGGNPMKMIDGIEVPLGIDRPSSPPIINIGTSVSPVNIQAVVSTGGSLTGGTSVSMRLAYRTALGVFPASGVVQIKISTDSSKVTLTWENPVMDIPALETMLFIGIAGGDEKLLTTLAAKETTFTYDVVKTASGEPASLYDQQSYYQYCVTNVRDVSGVKNESGPSSITPPVQSAYSRMIVIDPWMDGTLDSLNTVTWTSPDQPSFRIVAGTALAGSGIANALAVSSITLEADTNRVKCIFSTAHAFCNGERIFIVGCSPDPFNGLSVEIQVETGMFTSCYLVVGESFVPPGLSLAGVTAYRVPTVGIASMFYSPESGVIEVTTSSAHTFGADKVTFTGFEDKGWDNQDIPVLNDPNNAYRFFIENKSLPSDATFAGRSASRALSAIAYAVTGATGTLPVIGDILYLNMSTTGATGAAVKLALPVLATPLNAILVNANIAGATGVTGPTYSSGIQFVPKNDYITHRRVYRVGGTSLFQLVKEIPLEVLTLIDAIPDSSLGDVLPTLFTDNGVGVVVEPAPFGMTGLVKHYGMGFAWDPSSNRLRWTLTGNMDAWPPKFYRDFDHRILALFPFNQSLCVFCEDGAYRIEGTSPTMLQRHKTKAAPCRAGGSVQFLNNRLIYLTDEGLSSFDGQESTCLTDMKIPGDFWLSYSRYLDGSDPESYLVPFTQNAAFERLRGPDLTDVTPRCLMPYLAQHVNQRGIRSFIRFGKYYLYWGGDFDEYAAQTMLCIDFSQPGSPISVIGVKAEDAFVDEVERVHMILKAKSNP